VDWKDLHRDALVADSHNDSIVAHVRRGNLSVAGGTRRVPWRGTIDSLRGPGGPRPGAADIQLNIPKMAQGGIDFAFFSIDVTVAVKNRLAYALDGFGGLMDDLDGAAAEVVFVRHSEDVRRARQQEAAAILLAVEHADGTEGSLGVLRALYELGVRSIGLTHHISSAAADGCMEARDGVGLTHYGVALVREMNRLGMLVDLAHISPGGFFHALEVSTKPVAFTHGNCRALCDHPRNLTDEQLRALASADGIIGMSYVPFFVDSESPSIERLLDHVDHAVGVAGVDTVGLGSDFDGGGTVLHDATVVPQITRGLVERGYGEADIRKILGENMMRVLRATID
jgi:membrane dipeptidase